MRDIGAIQGFILELDDGTFASDFRVRKKKEDSFECIMFRIYRKYMMVRKQCVQLMDFFHQMCIQHESKHTIKQVKVPIANV
jgi:hypothetical protein